MMALESVLYHYGAPAGKQHHVKAGNAYLQSGVSTTYQPMYNPDSSIQVRYLLGLIWWIYLMDDQGRQRYQEVDYLQSDAGLLEDGDS